MTIKRNRSNNYAILEGTGRLVAEFEHVFLYDPDSQILSWTDPECFLMNERRRQVIELLRSVHPDSMPLSDIEKELGEKGIRVLLSRMYRDGLIARTERGRYGYVDRSASESEATV